MGKPQQTLPPLRARLRTVRTSSQGDAMTDQITLDAVKAAVARYFKEDALSERATSVRPRNIIDIFTGRRSMVPKEREPLRTAIVGHMLKMMEEGVLDRLWVYMPCPDCGDSMFYMDRAWPFPENWWHDIDCGECEQYFEELEDWEGADYDPQALTINDAAEFEFHRPEVVIVPDPEEVIKVWRVRPVSGADWCCVSSLWALDEKMRSHEGVAEWVVVADEMKRKDFDAGRNREQPADEVMIDTQLQEIG